MDSKHFLYEELNAFIIQFPQTRVRYEYDQNALVHVVEVLPREFYQLDSDYIEWENAVSYQFIDKFPTENICFISDDALVGIETAEFVLEGLDYYAPITSKHSTTIAFNTNIVSVNNNRFEKITYLESKNNNRIDNFDIPSDYTGSIISKAA